MSVLLDRATGQNVIIYTTEGGVDIEEVAESHHDPTKSTASTSIRAWACRASRPVKLPSTSAFRARRSRR